MSDEAPTTRRRWLPAVLAVAAVLVAGTVFWQLTGDDGSVDAAPTTTATPTQSPRDTDTPTPEPTDDIECEGPETQFNIEGIRQESLLPDCGTVPVSAEEQQASGLGLACGGSYPIIVYKTTTSDSKVSICGVDSSGVENRMVVRARGGEIKDLSSQYEYQIDAWVADDGATTYQVQAYDGTLVVISGGSRSTQESSDWISLDNEADYD